MGKPIVAHQESLKLVVQGTCVLGFSMKIVFKIRLAIYDTAVAADADGDIQ